MKTLPPEFYLDELKKPRNKRIFSLREMPGREDYFAWCGRTIALDAALAAYEKGGAE